MITIKSLAKPKTTVDSAAALENHLLQHHVNDSISIAHPASKGSRVIKVDFVDVLLDGGQMVLKDSYSGIIILPEKYFH